MKDLSCKNSTSSAYHDNKSINFKNDINNLNAKSSKYGRSESKKVNDYKSRNE